MEALQNALEAITWRSTKFPGEEFKAICANKTEAIPCLRSAIEKAVAEGENLDENYQLHFYAMYLLAEFQDREFFPKMMELASLPEKTLDYLMGDAMTESLPHILYNMYNGEIQLIKEAIYSPEVYDLVKSGLLRVMGQLYLDGQFGKEEWQEFLRGIVYGETIGDYMYNTLADVICKCHFVEMLPEIRRLYEDDRIDRKAIGGYDENVDEMFTYREGRERFCRQTINAAETLRGWAMFEDSAKEIDDEKWAQNFSRMLKEFDREYTKAEPKRKIGRNDPCPCGSGKKYKQCCLNKPKNPEDLAESEQERAKWLKDYPPAKKGGEDDRVYLEDYYSRESMEIDRLLYLALAHRAIPIWRREEKTVTERRQRIYLTAAFEKFRALTEKENIRSFQEYDKTCSIHYYCEDWLEILQELLQKEDEKGILEDVRGICGKMKQAAQAEL